MNKLINITKRIWIVVTWKYYVSDDDYWNHNSGGALRYGVRLCAYDWIFEISTERILPDNEI